MFGIPKEDDVVRTPPMEEEDSGPIIQEMRVQVRPRGEYGSRGARRIRRGERGTPLLGAGLLLLPVRLL